MSRALDDVSLPEGVRHLAGVGKILRHPLQAAGDPDFFRLRSVGHKLSHFAHGAHLVVDLVGEVPQLAVAVALAVNGDQHGDRVAEIGIDHRPPDAVGEFGCADKIHLVAQLGPELVGIPDIVLQFDIDDGEAGAACRIGLFLAHLGELEDVLFQGFRDLFFHLLGGRARVHRGDEPGPDGDRRIFRPLHFQEGMDADHDDHGRQNERNDGVA